MYGFFDILEMISSESKESINIFSFNSWFSSKLCKEKNPKDKKRYIESSGKKVLSNITT